jgi:hypothetical protein
MHGGIAFTEVMREQFEALRRKHHARLADRVLKTVGVRECGGHRVLLVADVERREAALLRLAGEVYAWYTGEERQLLYRRSVVAGVAIAKVILHAVGHPAEDISVELDGERRRALALRSTLP